MFVFLEGGLVRTDFERKEGERNSALFVCLHHIDWLVDQNLFYIKSVCAILTLQCTLLSTTGVDQEFQIDVFKWSSLNQNSRGVFHSRWCALLFALVPSPSEVERNNSMEWDTLLLSVTKMLCTTLCYVVLLPKDTLFIQESPGDVSKLYCIMGVSVQKRKKEINLYVIMALSVQMGIDFYQPKQKSYMQFCFRFC